MPDLVLQAAAIAKLYESLFGRKTVAKPAAPFDFARLGAHVLAEYRNDSGAIDAASACDLQLACSAAAALTMMPAAVAAEAMKKGALEGALAENYQELANVGASLFNRAGRLHVNLRGLHPPGARPPPELAALLPTFKQISLDVELAGYPGGKLALFYR